MFYSGNDRFSFSPRGPYSLGLECHWRQCRLCHFSPWMPVEYACSGEKPSVSSQPLLYVVASVDVAMRVDLFRRKTATNDRNRNLKGKGLAAVVVVKKHKSAPQGAFAQVATRARRDLVSGDAVRCLQSQPATCRSVRTGRANPPAQSPAAQPAIPTSR